MTVYEARDLDRDGCIVSHAVVTNDGEVESYDRYWTFGYAAARRGQPMSHSIYRLDRQSRGGYIDGYNAYLSDALRDHRESNGMVD